MNKFLLSQFENEGIEVVQPKSRKILMKKNPLSRLFEKGFISREQYNAAKDYQFHYELANISHHTRPSYDGSSISGTRKPKEGGMTQVQLDSSKFIFEANRKIELVTYVSVCVRGFYKVVDIKLIPILQFVFERQISIRAAEKKLGLNHQVIENRVRVICDVLTGLKK